MYALAVIFALQIDHVAKRAARLSRGCGTEDGERPRQGANLEAGRDIRGDMTSAAKQHHPCGQRQDSSPVRSHLLLRKHGASSVCASTVHYCEQRCGIYGQERRNAKGDARVTRWALARAAA